MGRPRKTETRQSVSIRLTETMVDYLDDAAKLAGCTRTEIVETAVDRYRNAAPYDLERLAQTSTPQNPATAPHKPRTDVREPGCAHPRDQRRRYTWGTTCGLCGTRL